MTGHIVLALVLLLGIAGAGAGTGLRNTATGATPDRVPAPGRTGQSRVLPGRDAFKVLLYASEFGSMELIAPALLDSSGGMFTAVDYLQAGGMPLRNIDSLLAAGYKAIMTWTDNAYLSDAGDSLAEFVDKGGGVVIATFADCTVAPINGRFLTQYMPVALGTNPYQSCTQGTVYVPGHPIMQGVTSLYGQNWSSSTSAIAHPVYTTRLADFTNGCVETAAFDSADRRVAYLGFLPAGYLWTNYTGSFFRMMVNALTWVASPPVHDVGAAAIPAPTGTVDSGTAITPRVVVTNYGTATEEGFALLRIGSYLDSVYIIIDAGQTDTYDFEDDWIASPLGLLVTRCSTVISHPDANPANDQVTDSVRVIPASSIEQGKEAASRFALECGPNPITGNTRISYSLPEPGTARIRLFDVSGKLRSVLAQGRQSAGRHLVALNTGQLAQGLYLLRFEAAGYTETRKLVVE